MAIFISTYWLREIFPGHRADAMKIKRPLFITAVSILVVIYAANTMPKSAVMFSLALFALLVLIHRFTVNRYTAALVLSFIAMLSGYGYLQMYSSYMNTVTDNLQAMDKVVLCGEIVNHGSSGSAQYFDVKIKTINGEKYHPFEVRTYNNDFFTTGDSIQLTGKFKCFTGKSNYIYNFSHGVFGYFYADEVELNKDTYTLNKFFNNISLKLKDNSYRIFNYRYSPVAVAMGLGDKDALDDNVVNDFNFTGVSHVLVVSGLHLGIIVFVLNKLFVFIPVNKKIKNIVLSLLLFIFMGMIGFTASIIRAGCLVYSMLLGKTLLKETDNYTSLAIVILITLALNPYSANNGSLLLSYSAYFGVMNAVQISDERNFGKIATTLLITVFACLYTSPVLALLGMDTTLLSPFYNLILSPVVMIICVLSFFLPVLYCVPLLGSLICAVLATVNEVCIAFLLMFTSFVRNNLSFAVVKLSSEIITVFIFSALFAVIYSYIQFADKTVRLLFIFIVPLVSVLCYNYSNKDIAVVRVFDGSSEPSYIVNSPDGDYLILTENINHRRLQTVTEKYDTTRFDCIFYCPEGDYDTEFISSLCNNIIVIDKTGTYQQGMITLNSAIEKRSMSYTVDIAGVKFVFNHKKTDLSQSDADFYFFGSDTPVDYTAANSYYFYPVIKANMKMVEERQVTELYDTLKIKINTKTGRYTIIKDVKNFGGQL